MSQGNSQTNKCHFFFVCFTKSENMRAEQVLPWSGGGGSAGGGVGEKSSGRVNIAQTPYSHVYKWKNDIC
jgi:hypothetical protein